MSQRVYYLRDCENIRLLPNGQYSRGNPKVCIVSELNLETNELKYGFSALHPKDKLNFDKSVARRVARDRMENGSHKNPPCSGRLVMLKAKTGHEINKAIIENIYELFSNGNTEIKKLARQWLKQAERPPSSKVLLESA